MNREIKENKKRLRRAEERVVECWYLLTSYCKIYFSFLIFSVLYMMQDLLPDCRDCIDSIWIKLKRDYRPITSGLYINYCSRDNNVFPYFHFWLLFISIFYTFLTKVTCLSSIHHRDSSAKCRIKFFTTSCTPVSKWPKKSITCKKKKSEIRLTPNRSLTSIRLEKFVTYKIKSLIDW